jgi:hypothetical protein
MEPKNIGVIVWTQEAVCARFVAERADRPGDIDGRSVPSFVTSTPAYKQWVEFWRESLQSKPRRAGRVLHNWAEHLKQTSRGNFCLTDGGTILGEITENEITEVADDLFRRLVEPSSSEELKDVALDQVADDVIRRLRLIQNANFHTRYKVDCRVAPNVTEQFEFSHAYRNGRLKRLYQRVPLAGKRTNLRRVVHDSAWMFEKVVGQAIVRREDAVALVYAGETQKKDPAISWSFDVLGSVARVANLADPNEALTAFVVE